MNGKINENVTLVILILVPIILAVFLSYRGMNARYDKLYDKLMGINEEITEVKKDLENTFTNFGDRLDNIEKRLDNIEKILVKW